MTSVIYRSRERDHDMEMKMSASSPAASLSLAHGTDIPATNNARRARPIRQGSFVLAVAALTVAACTGGAGLDLPAPVASESGNYCVDEAHDILQKTYGRDVKIKQAKMVSTYNVWQLWVKSDLCTGWFEFTPAALEKDTICTMPAYASAPKALSTMVGHGDCADLPTEHDRR
jgi:hypothetical protein